MEENKGATSTGEVLRAGELSEGEGPVAWELTDWLEAGLASGHAPGWRCSRSSTGPESGC